MRSLIVVSLLFAACASNGPSSARPGSHLVVLNKAENSLWVIEPNSGKATDQSPTGEGPHEVAVSYDGRLAVVANYGAQSPGHTLTVYDLVEKRLISTIDLAPHTRPHGIVFLDNRSTVLVTSETSRALLRVSLRGRKVERVYETGAELSHMVALPPDHKVAYTTNMKSGSVSAIDLESGKLLRTVETGNQPEAIDVSPDGKEVWVGHNADNKLVVLDARTLEKRAEIDCGPHPIRLKFTPDGAHVLVSTLASGEVAVIDAHARRELRRVAMAPLAAPAANAPAGTSPTNPQPIGIVIEPRGRFAYIANSAAQRISVIDLASWTIRGEIATGAVPDGMAWSFVARNTALLGDEPNRSF